MADSYRIKQFKLIAKKLNLSFSNTDDKGLLELVKDCSLTPRFSFRRNVILRNILSETELFKGRTVKIFDYLNDSDQSPMCTMMLIRSMEFDFPFTSIQPVDDLFPPKQPLLKRRRKQKIYTIKLSGNTHYVYTTDPDYWKRISRYLEPVLHGSPELFLELNNFFLFYSEKYQKLPTTKIVDFYRDGLKMMNLLQTVEYK